MELPNDKIRRLRESVTDEALKHLRNTERDLIDHDIDQRTAHRIVTDGVNIAVDAFEGEIPTAKIKLPESKE